MTDEELKALVASLAVSQKETDEQMKRNAIAQKETDEQMKLNAIAQKETSEQMKRTDAKLESVGIKLGGIGNNQGDVAEEFFYNSLIKDLTLGGIQFEDITKNMEKHRGKIQEEYDLFLTNGKSIAVIEVKYKAHVNDLDKLDRKVANFKKLYPIYKDYDLYGAEVSQLLSS